MKTVLIEQTSKKLKNHLIICWILIVVGIIGVSSGEEAGLGSRVLLFVAITWWLVTKFRIWYNHK